MIISHKYKFIFLKTTKTAGTSIEISLSRFCGKDDVITPIVPKDEKVRQNLGIVPQNYTRDFKFIEYTPKDYLRFMITGRKPSATLYWNHISAKQVKDQLGEEIWNEYFKFCFVRNPWDWTVSKYFWTKNKFDNNLQKGLKEINYRKNFNIYTIDDEIAVNYVARYENLQEELNFICQKLNIPFDGWLPHVKGKARTDKRHYSEILTEAQANFIREKCAREIELFGYEFEKPQPNNPANT